MSLYSQLKELTKINETLTLNDTLRSYTATDSSNTKIEYHADKVEMQLAFFYLIYKYRVAKPILEKVCKIATEKLQLHPIFVATVVKSVYNIDLYSDIRVTNNIQYFISKATNFSDIEEFSKYFNQMRNIPGFIAINKELIANQGA